MLTHSCVGGLRFVAQTLLGFPTLGKAKGIGLWGPDLTKLTTGMVHYNFCLINFV